MWVCISDTRCRRCRCAHAVNGNCEAWLTHVACTLYTLYREESVEQTREPVRTLAKLLVNSLSAVSCGHRPAGQLC